MSDDVEEAKCKTSEENHHQHGGRFSEGLLDKELILNSLNIQPGQTILDAGCGNGYMSKAFSNKVTHSGRVYALDHDKHYIGVIKKETKGTNIEAIKCDITRPIQMEQSSVDLIYISTVIHGFSKQRVQAFLGEVKRLLKPNGVLAIVEIEKKETSFGPPLNRRFSLEELKEIVPLAPLNTIQVGEHFYMQLFKNTEK
jgi:ubiquinone/menaquinone biosynthesis C-methylase UbiE